MISYRELRKQPRPQGSSFAKPRRACMKPQRGFWRSTYLVLLDWLRYSPLLFSSIRYSPPGGAGAFENFNHELPWHLTSSVVDALCVLLLTKCSTLVHAGCATTQGLSSYLLAVSHEFFFETTCPPTVSNVPRGTRALQVKIRRILFMLTL